MIPSFRDLRTQLNSLPLPPVAPKELQFPIQNNFYDRAIEGVYSLIKHAGLQPNHRVLDFGCGIGRLASPLVKYLTEEGSYVGLEVNAKAVEWCAENISAVASNFAFHHIDVFNDWYNPDATARTEDYILPFEEQSFQTSVLSSVFTHLSEEESENYLLQIGRVMEKKGRVWSSWYLINDEAKAAVASQSTQWKFDLSKPGPGYFHNSQKLGQAASFDQNWVIEAFRRAGMEVEHIYLGFWTGRKQQEQTSTGQA